MASCVFGSPITDSTLDAMPEYKGKNKTRLQRARVAMLNKYAEKKEDNARKFVENLQKSWGTEGVSTLCLIYNATGDPVTYQHHKDWNGQMGPAPPFPVTIANGQWGAFLHVRRTPAATTDTGSIAGIVYRGLNDNGDNCDWLLCWYHSKEDVNRAYAEVGERDHYPSQWDNVYDLLCKADKESKNSWNGCVSSATIKYYPTTTSPAYEGIMTLDGAGL